MARFLPSAMGGAGLDTENGNPGGGPGVWDDKRVSLDMWSVKILQEEVSVRSKDHRRNMRAGIKWGGPSTHSRDEGW